MDYKNTRNLSHNFLALDLVLELEEFDPRSEAAHAGFNERVVLHPALRKLNFEDFVPDLVRDQIVTVVDGGRVKITLNAVDWSRVFRVRADGTYVVFGSTVDAEAWPTFISALDKFQRQMTSLKQEIHEYLGAEHSAPARVVDLHKATSNLLELPSYLPAFRTLQTYREAAVLACRAEGVRLRGEKEALEIRARDRRVLDGVIRKLEHLEGILAIPGLASARTAHTPRITDFVNVGIIEKKTHERDTDEKFGILSAPTLFEKDFRESANGAFSRDRSFAVAFIDIDHFKTFNDEHLETVVDQDMLPYFMRALEAYCYRRAYAYRQGGDEYLVLLHNADRQEAEVFFEGLRAHFARIPYPDTIKRKPEVSIGVHVIEGNNEVTVFEAKKLSNYAKTIAKESGRNCVRFSTDPTDAPPAENGQTPLPRSP